jgi:hypothetical protein
MQDLIFNEDLEIRGGDFLLGYSDEIHQKHILLAEKGEYKQFPELGVGILNHLNSEDATALLIEAKRNFEYDRMLVSELKFTDENTLHVEAIYQ